ncbi:DNA cytosine methyltransferase [Ruminococcaceae bacterium OttesenSCG-928-L11]|nr:DNA cytosine methyltransferase [Ruminococcaceae bacterium OttesenSCG-928-L11]
MASLFDGIGGFPLAGERYGIKTLWASEIEKFPIAVTKIRFPEMAHVGDITKLKGSDLPPVDILCGGSPCQDVSQAGRRAGLAGERSGLFFEQIRLVKELRDADRKRRRTGQSVRPRYLIWENVPGALSSGAEHGEDFRIVLEEVCSVAAGGFSVPRPPGGRWESAGAVLGEEFSVAWRVVDARYWFVPQRRKRIFLVADFRGHTAPSVLFKQDSLLGHFTPREEAGQNAPANSGAGAEDAGGAVAFACNQRDEVRDLHNVSAALCAQPGMKQQTFVAAFSAGQGAKAGGTGYAEEVAPTLKAATSGTNMTPSVLCLNDQGGQCMDVSEDICGTLRSQMDGHPPIVMGSQQGGAEICEDLCPTITSAAGTSGNNQPVLFENHGIDSRYTGPHDVAPTVTARYDTGGNNLPLALDLQEAETYAISGTAIDRQPHNGGNGLGIQTEISPTLTSTDRHAVYSQQRSDVYRENDVASTQAARQCKDATDLVCDVAGLDCRSGSENGDLCGTLQAHPSGGYSLNTLHPVRIRNLIRRLTPLECERLMDFPDGWTDIPGSSDSKRYKALGNSVVVSCVEYILRGIAYFLSQAKDGEP